MNKLWINKGLLCDPLSIGKYSAGNENSILWFCPCDLSTCMMTCCEGINISLCCSFIVRKSACFFSESSESLQCFCEAVLHPLDCDLTASKPVGFTSCCDFQLSGPPRHCLKHLYTFSLSHTFTTFPVSPSNGTSDPTTSLSAFLRSVSSQLTACLLLSLLATACWIKHCRSLSQQICRLHQIRRLSLYPITDGSSKLIQDLSRTNVTPCFCWKETGPRWTLTDARTKNTKKLLKRGFLAIVHRRTWTN